jgi:ribonucleotide reductase alpha subunit
MAAASPVPDLSQIQQEPNLEKRSGLALDNAARALTTAREAYRQGEAGKAEAAVAEVLESVNLAYASLQQTGKNPRRSPKWFKRAEIATRNLMRRLDAFQQEMNYTDRQMIEKLQARVRQVHDELLVGLMEGKRK